MSNRVERTWAAVLHSPGYRRVLAAAPGKALFRSGLKCSSKLMRRRVAGSLLVGRYHDDRLRVHTCFLFFGHTTSGEIVGTPAPVPTEVCYHLGVKPGGDYLAASRTLIDTTPRLDRSRVERADGQIDGLTKPQAGLALLSRYRVAS